MGLRSDAPASVRDAKCLLEAIVVNATLSLAKTTIWMFMWMVLRAQAAGTSHATSAKHSHHNYHREARVNYLPLGR